MTSSSLAVRSLGALAALCLCIGHAGAQPVSKDPPPTPFTAPASVAATARVVRAANAFLATLDAAQRGRVVYAFGDSAQRVRWSNLPIRMSPRGGLSLGELSAAQRTAAMALVASALSARGVEKVQQMVEADEVLKNEGGNAMFGRDLYYVSLLGPPSERDPWMLQFGGHHLAVNVTIVGAHGVLTPSLLGAQPAAYAMNGRTVRPLGAESDRALALLNTFDAAQRSQAILGYRVSNLVLGPGQDGKTIQPEGLKASGMTERQRALLLELIGEWAGIVHESAAAARMAELRSDLNDTWFAWSGPTTPAPNGNATAYYRIQGPRVVIEYAPQQMGGDASLHIHAMYRDPTNDYGRRLVGR